MSEPTTRRRANRALLALLLGAAALGATRAGLAYESGQVVPEFGELTDTQGNKHSLARYRGKVVALVVWSSSCKTCQAYAEKLEALRKAYGARGVVFLGLAPNAGETAGAIEEAKRASGLGLPIAIDAGGAVCKAFSALTTPTVYVLDGERRLRYEGVIDDGNRRSPTPYLQQALDALLAGQAPPRAKAPGPGFKIKY